jgi:hypothetical protein
LNAADSQLGNFANIGSSFDAMLFFVGAGGVESCGDSLTGDPFRPAKDVSLVVSAIL